MEGRSIRGGVLIGKLVLIRARYRDESAQSSESELENKNVKEGLQVLAGGDMPLFVLLNLIFVQKCRCLKCIEQEEGEGSPIEHEQVRCDANQVHMNGNRATAVEISSAIFVNLIECGPNDWMVNEMKRDDSL